MIMAGFSSDFATLQFAQNLPKGGLTQIGQGIASVHQQKQALLAQKQAQEVYAADMQEYMQNMQAYAADPNSVQKRNAAQMSAFKVGNFKDNQQTLSNMQELHAENEKRKRVQEYMQAKKAYSENREDPNLRFKMFEAAQAIGLLDGLTEQMEMLDEEERHAKVRQFAEISNMATPEHKDTLLEKLGVLIEENKKIKNTQSVSFYSNMKKAVLDKDYNKVKEMVETSLYSTPEGRDFLEAKNEGSANKRADEQHFASLLELARQGLNLNSKEEYEQVAAAATGNTPLANLTKELLKYASIEDKKSMSSQERSTITRDWRDFFNDSLKRYEESSNSYASIASIYEGILNPNSVYNRTVEAQGTADIAMINLFQRIIDPATVREGDVALINDNRSLISKWEAALNHPVQGAILSDEDRKMLVKLAGMMNGNHKAHINKRVLPSVRAAIDEYGLNEDMVTGEWDASILESEATRDIEYTGD